MNSSSQGQSLVEFIFSLMLSLACLSMAGSYFRSIWLRSQCAYLVFEKTHLHLIGAAEPGSGGQIQIYKSPFQVTGEGRCGKVFEKVELPHLESAQWSR
jgi:hypothetical protein